MRRLHVIGNSHVRTLIGGNADDGGTLNTDDLEIVGLASGGATAHNLVSEDSSTGAREKSLKFLSDNAPVSATLLMFGDVDLTNHITTHGGLLATLGRYERFGLEVHTISPRVLVASIVGASAAYPQELITDWNERLEERCERNGWTFVDLTTPFIGFPAQALDPNERHLHPSAQGPMVDIIRAALWGYVPAYGISG